MVGRAKPWPTLRELDHAVGRTTRMKRPRLRRWTRRAAITVVSLIVLLAALVVVNGLVLNHGNTVVLEQIDGENELRVVEPGETVKLMTFNIAKCFVHQGGMSFDDRANVEQRAKEIGGLIRDENPDLVFLCEVVKSCGPCPVDQLDLIARESRIPVWAYGEHYNLGLPFYKVAGGAAILSRLKLEPVGNPDLPGRRPFYMTKNNRRALWCAATIAGRRVEMCSLHFDSFNPQNNLEQTNAVLDYTDARDVILAGDFNAQPHEPTMTLLKQTRRFAAQWDGPATFPSKDERIDYILAPRDWQVVEHRVIESDVSDHYATVTTYRVPD